MADTIAGAGCGQTLICKSSETHRLTRSLQVVRERDRRSETLSRALSCALYAWPMDITRITRAQGAFSAVFTALAIAAAAPTTLSAQASGASFTIAGSGESFSSLQDAVSKVGNARATILIAPGTYRQCAVQLAGSIRYQARKAGTAVFDSATCEGKAGLVLRGQSAEIQGLVFRNMRVGDGNGAGIRLEKGNLAVSQSWFDNSQQGILTGNDPNGRITIDKVTFSGLGTCENSAGCAHSIYIGDYGSLKVTRSRFERGMGGHYAKTRAANNVFTANSFDDANGRATNYMIDLPAGGKGLIRDNWFVQGRNKENYSAFIAVGAEQLLHRADGLRIENNVARFVPGLQRQSVFVADWTGHALSIGANELAAGLKRYEKR